MREGAVGLLGEDVVAAQGPQQPAQQSQIGAVDPAEVDALAKASPLWATYATEVDRESAEELLAAKLGEAAAVAADEEGREPPSGEGMKVKVPKPSDHPVRRSSPKRDIPVRTNKKDDGNVVTDYLKSREGRSMMNTVVRGVFGLLKRKR